MMELLDTLWMVFITLSVGMLTLESWKDRKKSKSK